MTHRIIILDLPHTLFVNGRISFDAIAVLNDLTSGTGADLVLLPTWPHDLLFDDIRTALQFAGVTANIVSCVPFVPLIGRCGDVQLWLDEWRWTVAAFAILSADNEFADEFGPLFVQCDDPAGLTVEIAQRVAAVVG